MPRARYIPELLQIHAEDLAFVWGQRRRALNSAEHTQRDYAELGERLEAHVQGLLCAPPEALLEKLGPGLQADDADDSFAAAYALLRSGAAAATDAVVVAFSRAAGTTLQGLREALCSAAPEPVANAMRAALQHAKPTTATAAAAVLAHHRLLPCTSVRLARLLEEADASTSALAWRAATLADRGVGDPLPARPYWLALSHADAAVREAGWAAVAWAGQDAVRPTLRKFAADGDAVALRWLATLGSAHDVPAVQGAALALDPGAARCALLARHGHPSGLYTLLQWMQGSDDETAVAAGQAFELITGIDVRGQRREVALAPDADEFARAMAPLAWFPDVDKARAALQHHQGAWATGLRWRRGLCLDHELSTEAASRLDMQARWDIAARSALAGGAAPSPPMA